jgi:hypothetical protein
MLLLLYEYLIIQIDLKFNLFKEKASKNYSAYSNCKHFLH